MANPACRCKAPDLGTLVNGRTWGRTEQPCTAAAKPLPSASWGMGPGLASTGPSQGLCVRGWRGSSGVDGPGSRAAAQIPGNNLHRSRCTGPRQQLAGPRERPCGTQYGTLARHPAKAHTLCGVLPSPQVVSSRRSAGTTCEEEPCLQYINSTARRSQAPGAGRQQPLARPRDPVLPPRPFPDDRRHVAAAATAAAAAAAAVAHVPLGIRTQRRDQAARPSRAAFAACCGP